MQGCISFLAGTAGGGEAFAYHQGELRSTEKVSIHTVWDATVNAINKLGFEVKKKAKDDVSAVLSAETAQDDSIHIELDRIKDNRTKISIRINYFGDEKLSKHIYQTIKERYE